MKAASSLAAAVDGVQFALQPAHLFSKRQELFIEHLLQGGFRNRFVRFVRTFGHSTYISMLGQRVCEPSAA